MDRFVGGRKYCVVQVKEITEGLQNINILVCKQEARLESGKVWWNYL